MLADLLLQLLVLIGLASPPEPVSHRELCLDRHATNLDEQADACLAAIRFEGKDDTDRAYLYALRCETLIRARREAEAIRSCISSMLLRTDYSWPRFLRGVAHLEMDEYEEADTAFHFAIRHDPDFTPSYAGRGIARAWYGRDEEALADFAKALPTPWELGRQRQAIWLLRRAVVARAGINRRHGRIDEARAELNALIQTYPDFVDALTARGDLLATLGDWRGAESDLDRAIAADGYDAAAYLARGKLRRTLGQNAAARADLDLAIHLKPYLAPAWIARAALRLQENDPPGALSDVERALRIDDSEAEPFTLRARIFEAMGQHDNARRSEESARRRTPQAPPNKPPQR